MAGETHAPAAGSGEAPSHNGSSGTQSSHPSTSANVENQHVESTSTKTSSQSTSRTPSEVPVAPLDCDDISVGNNGTSKGDSTKSTVPKQNADINENVGVERAKSTPENEQHVNKVQETKVEASNRTDTQETNSNNTAGDDIFKRGSFRKATVENAIANAPRDADGNMICPTCGEIIPETITIKTKNGDRTRVGYDLDHYPTTWNERVKKMKASGYVYTRKEVLDEYNRNVRVQCPPCNEGHQYEGIEGDYSNGK